MVPLMEAPLLLPLLLAEPHLAHAACEAGLGDRLPSWEQALLLLRPLTPLPAPHAARSRLRDLHAPFLLRNGEAKLAPARALDSRDLFPVEVRMRRGLP